MRTTIELPESIYQKGEKAAREQGVTIEDFILRALTTGCVAGTLPFKAGSLTPPAFERTGHDGFERLQLR